jgi:hypothetical protein
MVINNLNFVGSVFPSKHDPPLVIDANGVVSRQLAFQSLQSISRRSLQILQPCGRVQVLQFPLGHLSQRAGKPPRHAGMAVKEKVFRQLASKGDDHVATLSEYDNTMGYKRQERKICPMPQIAHRLPPDEPAVLDEGEDQYGGGF